MTTHDTTPTYDDQLNAASVSCTCGWSKVITHARNTNFARATAARLAGAYGRTHEQNPDEPSAALLGEVHP
jgi:hypothetical protein